MNIEILVVGELQENCYIVTKNDKTIIIDPGDEADKIMEVCKDKKVVEILITHHHFDHIGALKKLEGTYGLQENVRSGYFDYEVIKTPGHTKDSISFYFPKDKVLFSGDFLFYRTIGRTDLDTGSDADMIKSLELISKYPDDIIVYPGHGPKTMLGREKEWVKLYY